MKTISGILTVVVVGINIFFVSVFIQKLPQQWWMYLIVVVVAIFYFLLVIYLVSTAIHPYKIH